MVPSAVSKQNTSTLSAHLLVCLWKTSGHLLVHFVHSVSPGTVSSTCVTLSRLWYYCLMWMCYTQRGSVWYIVCGPFSREGEIVRCLSDYDALWYSLICVRCLWTSCTRENKKLQDFSQLSRVPVASKPIQYCKRRNVRRRKISYFPSKTFRMEFNFILSGRRKK